MNDKKENIDEEPVEEGPKEPIFNMAEVAELNGLIIPEGQGTIFQNKSVDLEFKAYENNPEAKMEAEFKQKLYEKEFAEAKKSGDWTKCLALKNAIPVDLGEIYRQERLAESKREIIRQAIESADYSLVGKLHKLGAQPDPPPPSLEQMIEEDNAKQQRTEMIARLCERARSTGDWSSVLALADRSGKH